MVTKKTKGRGTRLSKNPKLRKLKNPCQKATTTRKTKQHMKLNLFAKDQKKARHGDKGCELWDVELVTWGEERRWGIREK